MSNCSCRGTPRERDLVTRKACRCKPNGKVERGALAPFITLLGEGKGVDVGLLVLARKARWKGIVECATAVLDRGEAIAELVAELMRLPPAPRTAPPIATFAFIDCRIITPGLGKVLTTILLCSPCEVDRIDLAYRAATVWRLANRAQRFQIAVDDALVGATNADLIGYLPDFGDLGGFPIDHCERLGDICLFELAATFSLKFPPLQIWPIQPIAFATGIMGLDPDRACIGDKLTILGEFESLLPRLARNEVTVVFPVAAGCKSVPPISASKTAIVVQVPVSARSGCVGFVDLIALTAHNRWVDAMNAKIGLIKVPRCFGSPVGGIGGLKHIENPCPPCIGTNEFKGGDPKIVAFTVDGGDGIEVDTSGGGSVTIAWEVTNATEVRIQGPGFNGIETVVTSGSRAVALPPASAGPLSWTLSTKSFCSEGFLKKATSAIAVAVPALAVIALEPIYHDGFGALIRGHVPTFRVYIEDGTLTAPATTLMSLTITVRGANGFVAVLGPTNLTALAPGGDPATNLGHVFSLPLAAVQLWGCVEVDVAVSWSSPAGALTATANASWKGSTVRRATSESIYVYTSTFYGAQQTDMAATLQTLGWLEQMLPVESLNLVERGNIEIVGPFSTQHSLFKDGDANWLAYVLMQKGEYWGSVGAASVSHNLPWGAGVSASSPGSITVGKAFTWVGSWRGFWFRDDLSPHQTAYHEYCHTMGFGHFEGCSKVDGLDLWAPHPPGGQITEPVVAPNGWLAGDPTVTPVPDLSNGGAGFPDLIAASAGEIIPASTGDIMTYCSPSAPSREVFARLYKLLSVRGDPPLNPTNYQGCMVRSSPTAPRGTWLVLVGCADTLLATLTASRPLPPYARADFSWQILDKDQRLFASGTTAMPNVSHPDTDYWIIAVPWDVTAARRVVLTSADGASIVCEPTFAGHTITAEQTTSGDIEITWAGWGEDTAFASIDYRRAGRDDDEWRSLAGLVREADARGGTAKCRVVASLKGMPLAARLEVRVLSGYQQAVRVGTTTIACEVPGPAILWTSPAGDEVPASAVRLAVSAFAPGDGACLKGEHVRWEVDGNEVGCGDRSLVHLGDGEHVVRVTCVDSAGRSAQAERRIRVVVRRSEAKS